MLLSRDYGLKLIHERDGNPITETMYIARVFTSHVQTEVKSGERHVPVKKRDRPARRARFKRQHQALELAIRTALQLSSLELKNRA